jgi:hypothetical protein
MKSLSAGTQEVLSASWNRHTDPTPQKLIVSVILFNRSSSVMERKVFNARDSGQQPKA